MEPPRPTQGFKHALPRSNTPSGSYLADIIVADRRWHAAVPSLEKRIQRAVRMTEMETCHPCRPNILLTHNRAVKNLNALYRGRNKPTNVLTFDAPAGMGDGDIALAYETVNREAHAAGKALSAHLTHLLIHGLLHLGGHDHMIAGEARRMEQAETRVLTRLGIANPWRVGGRSWS